MTKYNNGPSWTAVILCLIFIWPVGLYLFYKKLTTDKKAAVKKDRKLPLTGWILLFLGVVFLGSFLDGTSGGMTELLFAAFFFCGGIASLNAAKKSKLDGEKYRGYIDAVVNHGLVSVQHIAAFVGVSEKQACRDLQKMIKMGYFEQAYFDEERGEIHLQRRQQEPFYQGGSYGGYQGQPGYGGGQSGYGGEPGYGGQSGYGNASDYGGQPDYGAPSGRGPRQVFRGGQDYRRDQGYGYGYENGGGRGNSGSYPPPGYGAPPYPPPEKVITCRNCGANNRVWPGSKNACEYCGSPLGHL